LIEQIQNQQNAFKRAPKTIKLPDNELSARYLREAQRSNEFLAVQCASTGAIDKN
jgi:hypothetical protein